MIKGKIHQEDITVITICAPNMGTSKYIKQLTDLNMVEAPNNHTHNESVYLLILLVTYSMQVFYP